MILPKVKMAEPSTAKPKSTKKRLYCKEADASIRIEIYPITFI